MIRKCNNCKYFDYDYCRFYPPSKEGFPRVSQYSDWCREFVDKEKEVFFKNTMERFKGDLKTIVGLLKDETIEHGHSERLQHSLNIIEEILEYE